MKVLASSSVGTSLRREMNFGTCAVGVILVSFVAGCGGTSVASDGGWQCAPEGAACRFPNSGTGECCSQYCGSAATCACSRYGKSCTTDDDCCVGAEFCTNGSAANPLRRCARRGTTDAVCRGSAQCADGFRCNCEVDCSGKPVASCFPCGSMSGGFGLCKPLQCKALLTPCSGGECCDGLLCQGARCCKGVNEACGAGGECCSGQCASSKCTDPTPGSGGGAGGGAGGGGGGTTACRDRISCLQVVATRGQSCGSPDSLEVCITNTCAAAVDWRVCLDRTSGTPSCFAHNEAAPGYKDCGPFTCNSPGTYRLWASDPSDPLSCLGY